jgi:HlyD family secretion protein
MLFRQRQRANIENFLKHSRGFIRMRVEMTTKKKMIVAVLLIITIGSIVAYSLVARNRGVIAVQTGRVVRQDLKQTVTANGEIKPKRYVNISSNMMGRIVHMPVKEGDHVDAGQLLIRLESIQSESDVTSAQASLDAALAELEGMAASARSSEASINSARAEVTRAEADYNRAKLNYDRGESMSKEGLISREQFDQMKASLDIAAATVNSSKARLAQTEAQTAQVNKQREGLGLRINQQRASLTRARDQFSKTTIMAPLAGVITYLPVNEGEIAIVGLQNSPGTTLMTIADMSVITAELKVDETDIVNLKLGQEAEIKVDALGDRLLPGHVSEIGNSALSRSGGIATTSANSQEAKDFKVVITLDNPPAELRPGLSASATIVTATRQQVITVPIQAITVREFDEEGKPSGPDNKKKKIEQEGVFVLKNGVATFRRIKTGIIGATEIEILDGLTENEEIVTGTFQVLRTLQDNARTKVEPKP